MRPPPPSGELEQTKRVLATKLVELSALNTERQQWVARLAERDARIAELEAAQGGELPRLRTRVVDLESELSVLKHEVDRLGHLDAEAAALRGQARRLETAVAEHSARVGVVEAALAEREARIRELEGEIDSLAWGSAPADDLTRIKGIGPKFRDALRDAGVTSFAQIAAWTEADVATIATKLRIQPSRIVREGWVESARAVARS